MRKSILIGVLAALMLFAFTACEPQVVDLTGGNRTAQFVVVTQNTPFIEGQSFVADNFDVAIYYSDGGEPQVLPGTGIVELVESDANNKVNEGDKVKANITTTLASKELAINVIALEDCEISDVKLATGTVPSVYVNEDAAEAVNLSSNFSIASVTYTYEGITYTSTESTDFDNLTIVAEISVEAQKTVGTADITVTVKDGETVVAEIPATCNVVKKGADSPIYDSYEVYFATESAGIGTEADPAKLFIDDTVYLKVVEKASNTGSEQLVNDYTLAVNGVLLEGSDVTTAKGALVLKETAGTAYSVYVDGKLIDTVTVPAGNNFMTTTSFDDIIVAAQEEVRAGETVISTSLVKKNDVAYKVNNTDYPCEDGVEIVSVKNEGLKVPATVTGTYTITVNIEKTIKGVTTPDTVDVEFAVASAD